MISVAPDAFYLLSGGIGDYGIMILGGWEWLGHISWDQRARERFTGLHSFPFPFSFFSSPFLTPFFPVCFFPANPFSFLFYSFFFIIFSVSSLLMSPSISFPHLAPSIPLMN